MADKLEMMSSNIILENIDYIALKFPNAVTEVKDNGKLVKKVDFNMLKQELSSIVIDDKQERYHMTWPDKKKSILNANGRINATLRPNKKNSLNFDKTKNLYIEGDNLGVLKLLRETYLGKIKMIYIDPPYNTGNDFVYCDRFMQNEEEYLDISGQFDEEKNRLFQNSETNGRFHTDWLNMMYPRLKVARDLLAEDGAIFISIDYHELFNLQKICDEIFSSRNYITVMPRKTVEHMRVLAAYELQTLNDYILIYCKDISKIKFIKEVVGTIDYNQSDEHGKYELKAFQNSGSAGTRKARPNLYYPIYYNSESKEWSLEPLKGFIEILPKKMMNEDGRWLWSKEKFLQDNKFLEYKNNTIYRKSYFVEGDDQNKYQSYRTWLDKFPNRLGAKNLSDLGMDGLFDYSKPVELIYYLLKTIIKSDDTVLDFFSGSSTTAHAVIKYQVEQQIPCKFIMVQLPEKIDENAISSKKGFKNICDIGRERIHRAINQIKNEVGIMSNLYDFGFRTLSLDSSNMKDIYYNPNTFEQTRLVEVVSHIKEDRTPLDLLFQVMLELGIELSAKIEEKEVSGKTCFVVNENDIVACFDDGIDDEVVKELANIKSIYAVFKDSAFSSDAANINCEQIFKSISPSTNIKVI